MTTHAQNAQAESLGFFGRGAPPLPDTEYRDGLPRDESLEMLPPVSSLLLRDERGNASVKHHKGHGDVLPDLGLVDTAVVDEANTFRKPVQWQEVLDPGADDVDPFQVGRHRLEIFARKVPTDEDVSLSHSFEETFPIDGDARSDETRDVSVPPRRRLVARLGDMKDRWRLGVALKMYLQSLRLFRTHCSSLAPSGSLRMVRSFSHKAASFRRHIYFELRSR